MEKSNAIIYDISIEDVTPRIAGVKYANGVSFHEKQEMTTDERPQLQHIIDWIDAKADTIHDATKEMLKNPGTKILHLHARFPIRSTAGGHFFHETIPAILVDGSELDRLKAKVTEIYDAAEQLIQPERELA